MYFGPQQLKGGFMKTIFMSLVSVLFAATAFAMPTVGDNAVYNVTISQGGQSMTGTLESTITAANNGAYTIESKINMGGQSQVQNDQRTEQDMVSDALVGQILGSCAQYGGKMESVTVPAGTFNACALPADPQNGTGYTWVAQVAFGVVKVDTTDTQGQRTYGELKSFKFGK
jgi:hypothetical protein